MRLAGWVMAYAISIRLLSARSGPSSTRRLPIASRRQGRPSSCTSGTTRSPMKLCTCGSCWKRSFCGLGVRTNARVHSTICLVGVAKCSLTWLIITTPVGRSARASRLFCGRGRRKVGLAEIPEQPRHRAEPFAGDRRKQMLVRRVLRTSGIRVRDPDRAQAEHVGKGVVGQRSAEIGKNRGRASGRALDRTGGETDPRILRIESAGAENAALAAVHLDLNEAVAVEVAAQRRNDVVHVRSHHVTQLTMGAGMARNGVDRTLRRAGGEGQHLEAVPAEDAFGRRELR